MPLAIFAYAFSMTAANLSVAAFGPLVTPLNAFLFIGLDLVLRDWLHVRLRFYQMAGLIFVSGLLTYLLNPATEIIAIASTTAFTLAALSDWAIFSRLKGSWPFRVNASNVGGAAVDSIVFPAIAFGAFLPHIIIVQFLAKVFGGFLWSLILRHEQPTNC